MARVVDVSPQKYFEKFEDGALIVGEGLARFQRLQAATFGTNDDLFSGFKRPAACCYMERVMNLRISRRWARL